MEEMERKLPATQRTSFHLGVGVDKISVRGWVLSSLLIALCVGAPQEPQQRIFGFNSTVSMSIDLLLNLAIKNSDDME